MTNELETCPICEDGKLHPKVEMRTFGPTPWEDGDLIAQMEYSVCDGCKSEIADSGQVNRNAQAVRDARNGQL